VGKKLVPAKLPAATSPILPRLVDAIAIQALFRGEADGEQQKIAVDWIVKRACGIGDWPYRESQRETDLMLGRQFVGQQIIGAVNINVSKLRSADDGSGIEHVVG